MIFMKNLLLIALMITAMNVKAEGFVEALSNKINNFPVLAKSDVKSNKSIVSSTKKAYNKTEKKVKKIITAKKHKVMFGVGQIFLFSDFSKKGNDKIVSDLEYIYVSQKKFDVTLDTHIFSLQKDDKEVTVWSMAPSIKYNFYKQESMTFYYKGAFGFYNVSMDESKWVFGVNLGAGAEVDLNDKYMVGIKTDYHMPFEVQFKNGDIIDGSYMRLLVQMGLKF